MTIYLVSCVSKKQSAPAPARDLYTSGLFNKARSYVAKMVQPWFVLSANMASFTPTR